MTIKNRGGVFGRNPTFNDVDVDGTLSVGGNAVPAANTILVDGDIGVTVQAYDAATAKTNVSQTFTALQNFNFAGGGNYVATFQTTSTSTPYTVNIGETSGSANGYPLFRVGQSYAPYTDYFRVDSGTSNITVGKNLAMANGKGIDFSATAGTGTSELLSDYETGVFTPAYTFASAGTSSFGYSAQIGHYVKVGDTVHFQLDLRFSSFSKGTASGNPLITGLPFTSANHSGYASAIVNISTSSAVFSSQPTASVGNSATYIYLNRLVSDSGAAFLDDADSNAIYFITGSYIAA